MDEDSLELLEQIRDELKEVNRNINIIFWAFGIGTLIVIVQWFWGIIK